MEPISANPRTLHPPQALSALATRLNAWRSTRSVGQRISEDFWKAATELARVHGVSSATAALKLNYYDLQRRLGMPVRPRKPQAKLAQFVELPSPRRPEPSPDPGTLEVIRSNGSRLTLRLPTARARDLLPLVSAFLRS